MFAYCGNGHKAGRRADELADGTVVHVVDVLGETSKLLQMPDPRPAAADGAPQRAPRAWSGNRDLDYLTGDFTATRIDGGLRLTHTSGQTFDFDDDYVFDWPRYHLPPGTPDRFNHGDVDVHLLHRQPRGHWTREGSEEEWVREHSLPPGTRLCYQLGPDNCRKPAVAITLFHGSGHMGMDRVAHCADHGFEGWLVDPPRQLRYLAIEERLTDGGVWEPGEVLYERG